MSEIKITVEGPVGSGKSALLGEIEILCKALGVPVRYADPAAAASEKAMTHADWITYLEMYKPSVVLHEKGPDRAGDEALARLAEPHTGMRVDYQGLLRQAREGLHDSPGLAEMLRQLQGHLRELGQRWYAGDTAVVDELLQLYCVESNARAALSATPEPPK